MRPRNTQSNSTNCVTVMPAARIKDLGQLALRKRRAVPPLDGNLDLADCDRQRHMISQPRFETTYDCFPDVLQGLRFRPPLRYTPRDRWTLGDNHAGLIRVQGDQKLHI
jgi:hypothetical protein